MKVLSTEHGTEQAVTTVLSHMPGSVEGASTHQVIQAKTQNAPPSSCFLIPTQITHLQKL